jgi:hypothetical protein
MLRAWIAYALAGAVLTVVLGLIVSLLGGADITKAVWLAAGFAYALQTFAFGLLLLARDQASLFTAAWAGGMLLRFGAVGGFAFWAPRFSTLQPGTLLLSLAGFFFLLLLLEPVFLRWDLRRP